MSKRPRPVTKGKGEGNKKKKSKSSGDKLYKQINEQELKASAARDGGKKGDILVGVIRGNFGVAIDLLSDIQPIPRRGHLCRVIERIMNEEQAPVVTTWKEEASKHIDWPHSTAANSWPDADFVRVVSLILEGYSAFKGIAKDLLNYYNLPKISEDEKRNLTARTKNELGFSLEHAQLPLHACILDVPFRIIDPGTGEKSSIFRQMMEESQERENGISFDDLSQCIQKETGSNDATFFLNYDNMVHADGGHYKYEDEVSRAIRESGSFRSYLQNDMQWFARSQNYEDIFYILEVTSNDGSHVPEISCELVLAKERERPQHVVREWNFPSLPKVHFMYVEQNSTDSMETKEEETGTPKSTIKLTAGLLKSLLQKQIRRGFAEEAVITANSLKNMPSTYNPQFHTSTSGSAALLQRIIIILIEDVGYSVRISPICWLAFIATHDRTFKITEEMWRYVWDVIYQQTKRTQHEFFHGTKCKLKQAEISDYSTLFLKFPHLSAEQLAFAFGLEIRCREPGMASDKEMIRKVIHVTLHENRVSRDEEQCEVTPAELLQQVPAWKDELLFDMPCAVDFHAYPAIVDRIFEWDVSIYSHYFHLSKSSRKSSSVDLLRNDMWNYSSSINCRDAQTTSNQAKYWHTKVEPIFKNVVLARLKGYIH